MNRLLRLEALSLLIATLVAYHCFCADWTHFAAYFLVPDVSLFFFLLSPKVGSVAYNLAHNTIFPAATFVCAILCAHDTAWLSAALIWFAHVHFDRALGYGLKMNNSFSETHLGRIGRGA